MLVMTGANSAVGLRSMPVRYLFLDEVDGYPLDVEGEGDAISLAEARTRTFARRKIFIVSTPTVAGVSAIEREYEASDQRRFFLPCPHCGHRQWLRFEQLRWERGQPRDGGLRLRVLRGAHRRASQDLDAGAGRVAGPGPGERRQDGGLSPLLALQPGGLAQLAGHRRRLGERGEQGDRLGGGHQDLQEHRARGDLGRGRRGAGLAAAAGAARGLPHRAPCPLGGLLLVGGADVQKDRIEASIWAFGRGKASWLVEHRVLMGDTARDAVWDALGGLLDEHWTHASGAAMPLARFALDTGFATQEAYAFVRARHDPRLMAVKGVARGAALIGTPTAVDVSQGGKRLRRGIKVFTVAVGIAKLELYNNLRKGADVAEDGVDRHLPGGLRAPAPDRRGVPPAAVRRAAGHPPGPQWLSRAGVAEAARAQRGPGLLRLRPSGGQRRGLGPLRGPPLAGTGTTTRGGAGPDTAATDPDHRSQRGHPKRWPWRF